MACLLAYPVLSSLSYFDNIIFWLLFLGVFTYFCMAPYKRMAIVKAGLFYQNLGHYQFSCE